MLCPSCRRQLERGASYCGSCGTPLNGASAPLELVLADATRVPVVSEMTIGRAPGATLVLSDPSVSRVHARISAGAVLEDAGCSEDVGSLVRFNVKDVKSQKELNAQGDDPEFQPISGK